VKIKTYVLILLLVGFLVYANSLGNGFVWDDEEMVVKNASFFQLKNLPQLFSQATFYSGGTRLSGWFYRPLVMASFLLTKTIFGLRPWGFHLVQIIFHLANGILVFLVFRELFSSEKKRLVNPLSFILALIFIVHPANVESVAYIASVAEPLYTFFLLSLFLLLIKARNSRISGKRNWLVILLFFFALLTKEGALVFFPILLFYFFIFQKERLGFTAGLLSAGLLAYLFVRLSFFGLQAQPPDFLAPIGRASLRERLLTAPFIFFSFLKTFFYPKVLSISQHVLVKQIREPNFWQPLIATITFWLSSSLFLLRRHSRLALFFFTWFVISLIPVSNLVIPLDMTFAERWLYFPAIGLLGFLGTFILALPKLDKNWSWVLVALLMSAVLLGARTMIRNRDWRDGLRLYSHDLEIQPNAFDLQNNLGVELFRQGEKEKALKHFEKSVELQPEWSISNNNLGAVYESLGEREKAGSYYKRSVELGDYYLAYENYALFLFKEGKYQEAENFLKEKALKKFPKNQKLWQIYYLLLNEKKPPS